MEIAALKVVVETSRIATTATIVAAMAVAAEEAKITIIAETISVSNRITGLIRVIALGISLQLLHQRLQRHLRRLRRNLRFRIMK
jgi:hypothetical protein